MVRESSEALSIEEKAELTPAKGAKRGALGAAARAIIGKVTDQGSSNAMLEDVARDLEPGESAILAVVDHDLYPKTLGAVEGHEKVMARTYWADDAGVIELGETKK